MTRTPLSRSKGQRSRSPGRFDHRRVGASGGCSGGRGNVLAVGNCCYVAVCSAAQCASAPTVEERAGAYRAYFPCTCRTTFKVKRSRSPCRFTHRGFNVSGSCSGQHGNVFGVGKLLLRCGVLGGARRFGAHRGRRGTGTYRGGRPRPAYSLLILQDLARWDKIGPAWNRVI